MRSPPPPLLQLIATAAAAILGVTCVVNALSISSPSPSPQPPRHDFPRTKHGDRSAILQSDGFAKSITFLNKVHKERYASCADCPILGPAWKEHDENGGQQLLSPSLLVSNADFTSYSRREQRDDAVAPLGSSASQLSAEFASIARKQQGGGGAKGFASSTDNNKKSSGDTKGKKRKRKKWSADDEDEDAAATSSKSNADAHTASPSLPQDPSSFTIDGKPFLTCPTLFDGIFCHVTNSPIFTPEECRVIIDEAESDGDADTWSSHEQYYKSTKITKRIIDLPQTKQFFGRACIERIFPLLQSMYPTACPQGENGLRDFRIFTAKVLKYDAASGNDYLGVHHDGSLLTFLIGLNGLGEYEGGGTYMEALGKAVRYEAGHLCCHPGIVRHGGDKVTSGVRYVLAAWIDISGVIEYDRQLCEEADLTRMSGRLDQTIQYDLGGSANTGKPDKRLDKAEKWYLYSLAAGEKYGHDGWDNASSGNGSVPRPTSENAWLGLGQLWLDQGKSVEASDAFRNALDLSPYNTRAWISYGLALVNMNDTKGAEHAFQTAADLNEFEFDALSNLGLLYSMLERHQDAADTYEKAVERINQGSDGSIKADKRAAAELFTNWGVTLCDLGKYREAMVVFAKAVVIDNTFHDAATNLKAVKDALGA